MHTDEELAVQCQHKDEAAFQELVRRHTGPLFNFLYRYTRDRQTTEDLTQETFIKGWRHIKKFDPRRRFNTWLFTIARRTALDALKKKRNLVFSDFENEEGKNVFLETTEDPSPPPILQAEHKAFRGLFLKALDTIPGRYREVLLLRYTDDQTFDEIASILGRPLNTIKSWHRRGLTLLKEKLPKP